MDKFEAELETDYVGGDLRYIARKTLFQITLKYQS